MRQFSALGFFRNRRKDSAVKNLARALHADRVGCTLQVVREVKMEIPVNKDAVVHEDRFV
jgi:hypothetical protein